MDYNKVRAAVQEAAQVDGELSEEVAKDVAFHMADWLEDLEELYQVFQQPESHSTDEVGDALFGFLVHAPNHIAAAAKLLTGFGVKDIFGVGAVEIGEET